jgi:uncharacterized protein (UPF0305 family)
MAGDWGYLIKGPSGPKCVKLRNILLKYGRFLMKHPVNTKYFTLSSISYFTSKMNRYFCPLCI